MKNLPTDRDILRCIYKMYAPDYPGPLAEGQRPSNDPYLPIDVKTVAARLGAQPELIFGRLYYHLDTKYRYQQNGGGWVSLFLLDIQGKGHSVNFPYLAALFAGQNYEHRKQQWSLALSLIAIGLSTASLIANIVGKF